MASTGQTQQLTHCQCQTGPLSCLHEHRRQLRGWFCRCISSVKHSKPIVNITSPWLGTTPHSAFVRTPVSSNSNNEPFLDSNTSSQIPSLDRIRHVSTAKSPALRPVDKLPLHEVAIPTEYTSHGTAKGRLPRRLWVGTLGSNTDGFRSEMRMNIDKPVMTRLSPGKSIRVRRDFRGFLYTARVLWPCLHYAVPDAPMTKCFYESASLKQYRSFNWRFADVIV
ncbi:hypothetical protein EV401DRAFT_1360917 [Pisolithus croceorrhizus]|nr:hypothetical protein EV401DRAFT_1360917 [Pisolithus croceorrhizus]